jgi:mersacidin/lichenicidin family type 2 lantibiotic
MTNREIIRSWKDEDYRLSLASGELALLPENPAGLMELTDEDLRNIDGAATPLISFTVASIVFEVTHHSSWFLACK